MATTRDDIERQITTTKSDSFAALSRAISLPADSPERVEAERRVNEAQQRSASLYRRLAEEFGAEVVVPLNLGILPSPSISGATLLPGRVRRRTALQFGAGGRGRSVQRRCRAVRANGCYALRSAERSGSWRAPAVQVRTRGIFVRRGAQLVVASRRGRAKPSAVSGQSLRLPAFHLYVSRQHLRVPCRSGLL